MKELKLDISDRYRYLVAVSGGPDSMALLDMAFRKGIYLEVAHVNYHKRDTADRDENIVRKYCRKRKIDFHLLDYEDDGRGGNFQAKARKARYAFFRDVMTERGLDYVLVAHHLDDHLETYLMQKEKKIGTLHYGLKRRNEVYGAKLIRPLLKYEKNSLIGYCQDRDIAYGIDESNLVDGYARNKVRHALVEKMSLRQKKELAREIADLNRRLDHERKTVLDDMKKDGKRHEVSFFVGHPYVRLYLHSLFGLSEKSVDEMLRQLKSAKRYVYAKDGVTIAKEYGYVSIFDTPEKYRFRFEDVRYGSYGHFRIAKKGTSLEGVTLNADDFPLIVRNAKEGDSIRMRYGTKKLNRFFIDRKIPLEDRLSWPVVENREHRIVLVPGLGCDCSHYSANHSIFVIKL